MGEWIHGNQTAGCTHLGGGYETATTLIELILCSRQQLLSGLNRLFLHDHHTHSHVMSCDLHYTSHVTYIESLRGQLCESSDVWSAVSDDLHELCLT